MMRTSITGERTTATPNVTTEIFVIPLEDDRYIVYAPLRRAAFVADAGPVNFVADLRDGRYDRAADADGAMLALLRRLEMVDSGPDPLPPAPATGDPRPTSVTLFLTTGCNLRCDYCYAAAGDTPLAFMSLATAMQGIDFILANAIAKGADTIEIAYHGGGEPSMNWRVLTRSFAYAQEQATPYGIRVLASAATNGVLRDTQIDWMIEHLSGASVSFDGLPAIHDAHRPTVGGKPSSSRVLHTLTRFDAAGMRYGIRVTVTRTDLPSLPDAIDFICTRYRPVRIQVEPAYQLGRWKDAPSTESEGFIAAYRDAQGRAAAHGQEITYSAARLGLVTNHFCGVTQDLFALSPEGNVSACYEVFSEDNPRAATFFYGRSDANGRAYSFDLPVLNHLRGQVVQHRDYCSGCFAKWTCAGDCYHKALTVSESGAFEGSDRCHVTRELTTDQILAKIAAAGGWYWHEGAYPSDAWRPAGKELLV